MHQLCDLGDERKHPPRRFTEWMSASPPRDMAIAAAQSATSAAAAPSATSFSSSSPASSSDAPNSAAALPPRSSNPVHAAAYRLWACNHNMAFLLAELRRLQARQTLAVALTRQLAVTRQRTAELRATVADTRVFLERHAELVDGIGGRTPSSTSDHGSSVAAAISLTVSDSDMRDAVLSGVTELNAGAAATMASASPLPPPPPTPLASAAELADWLRRMRVAIDELDPHMA